MKLIGLSGKARSGKDTLADCLEFKFAWTKFSLATSLKLKAKDDFEFTDTQVFGTEKDVIDSRYGVTPRTVLIELGKFYRSIDPLYWIKKLNQQILEHPQAQLVTAVIADVRFVNEANWIKKHGGFMVRLNRPIEMRGMELDDPSETNLDDYSDFDLIIPESRNVDLSDVSPLADLVFVRATGAKGIKVA